MSFQYDQYLTQHRSNVKRGFDWIAENLRRQRKAWHALLAAFTPKKPAPARTDDRAQPGKARLASAVSTAPAKAGEPRAEQKFAAGQARILPDAAAQKRLSGEDSAENALPEGNELRAALTRRSALRRQRFSQAAEAARAELPENSPAVFREPQVRAQELSRTVERDARRYDGGFSPF